MKLKALVLLVLLIALAAVSYFRFGRDYLRKSREKAAIAAAQPKPTPAKPPLNLSTANTLRRLPDGSFNPNPPVHPPLDQSPRELLTKDDWRARYRPLLEASKPKSDAPSIFIYPFLDLTHEGAGIQFTYGWRLAASAALEHWTNARVISRPLPKNYGLPTYDDLATTLTLAAWQQRALNDPAAANADYVLTGWYSQQPGKPQVQQQIVLLPKRKQLAQNPMTVHQERQPKLQWFGRLSKNQRDAMKALAKSLIEKGIVQARTPGDPGDLNLNKELDQVAVMLDANDSWAQMEGIDRALQLAALFPKDTLPLQAATYGMNVLTYCDTLYDLTTYRYDYGMRAFALAQLTLAMDDLPSMSQINWLDALRAMDNETRFYGKAIHNRDDTKKQPELELQRMNAFNFYNPVPGPDISRVSPTWAAVAQDARMSWFIGHSEHRDYFNRSEPNWLKNDFFFRLHYRTISNRNYYVDRRKQYPGWTLTWKEAQECFQGTLPQEIACALVSVKDPKKLDALKAELKATLGVSAGTLDPLIAKDDYFQLREVFQNAVTRWPPETLYLPTHPVYRALQALTDALNAIDGAEDKDSAGYGEFEFTPWDRLNLYRRNDDEPFYKVQYCYGYSRGPVDWALAVIENFQKVRPEALNGRIMMVDLFKANRNSYNADTRIPAENIEAIRHYPLNPQRYQLIADSLLRAGRTEEALLCLYAYMRMDPHEKEHNLKLATTLSNYGYRRESLKYYDLFLDQYPDRYDIGMDRAWVLCQMGRWKDPALRAIFADPIKKLPGNVEFHQNNLNYLENWVKDYDGAQQALRYYEQCCPDYAGPYNWVELEHDFDHNDKALEYLKSNDPSKNNLNNTGRENAYCRMGQWALTLDQMPLAEQYMAEADKIGAGTASAIHLHTRIAYLKKDYSTALSYARQELERYGPDNDTIEWMAYCLYELNFKDEAIKALEDLIYTREVNETDSDTGFLLMGLYVRAQKKAEADRLWKLMLQHGRITRRSLSDMYDEYRQVNPAQAEADWKRIDEIIAGPSLNL